MDTTLQVGLIGAAAGFSGSVLGAIITPLISAWIAGWRKSDTALFMNWRTAFDRPAFQDLHQGEENQPAFLNAMQDTLQAITTGTIYSRKGLWLGSCGGKGAIKNSSWVKVMEEVSQRIRTIIKKQTIFVNAPTMMLSSEIDAQRYVILEQMNHIWKILGITAMDNPYPAQNPWPPP